MYCKRMWPEDFYNITKGGKRRGECRECYRAVRRKGGRLFYFARQQRREAERQKREWDELWQQQNL